MRLLNLKQLIIATMLLTGSCPFKALALSADGGTSGGGGTLIFPTTKQVREAIEVVWSGPDSTNDSRLELSLINLDERKNEIQDPTIRKVLKSFFRKGPHSTSSAVERVLQSTQYEIVDGPCYYNNIPKPAALIGSNFGKGFPLSLVELEEGSDDFFAKICYSASELAKVPRANLQQNIIALSIHELSHVFGYDESVAHALQDYLLESGKRLLSDSSDQDFYNAQAKTIEIQYAMAELRSDLKAKKPDMVLCARIAALAQLDDQFGESLAKAFNQSEMYPMQSAKVSYEDLEEAGDKLANDIYPLMGFCGIRDREAVGVTLRAALTSSELPYLDQSDRAGLSQRLKKGEADILKIQKRLKVNVQN